MITEKYKEIRDDLKTGDILLFSGQEPVSGIIKLVTRSKWSHSAMVLKIPDYDMVFIWESGISKAKDFFEGKPVLGVQLVLLSERLRLSSDPIICRPLKNALTDDQYQKMIEFRNEIKNRPYEKNMVELFKSAYDGPFGQNKEDLSSIFCSEMIAEALQRVGLLTEDIPSNEWTPADFSVEKNKPQINALYGPEIVIQ